MRFWAAECRREWECQRDNPVLSPEEKSTLAPEDQCAQGYISTVYRVYDRYTCVAVCSMSRDGMPMHMFLVAANYGFVSNQSNLAQHIDVFSFIVESSSPSLMRCERHIDIYIDQL